MRKIRLFQILALFLLQDPEDSAPKDPIVEGVREAAGRLIEEARKDSTAWQRLGFLGDHFPSRLAGTENLEKAIVWALEAMKKDGLDNVRAEKVKVPHWVRGEEGAEILEPAFHRLPMLGLGGSVGTPPQGITAEVAVVRSFDELETLGPKVKGKIVCYNVPYEGYGKTVRYRGSGASRAAKHGALAALLRSVGPVSMQTPHTGGMHYDGSAPQIPAAAVTIEGAEMLQRMQDRGEKIVLRLKMGARMLPDADSANVLAEVRGREKPDEIVLLGGHFDSWDVGPSVLDDGGGCIASWEALRLVRKLGLKPRRTIRVVLWTNEENGLKGALAYRDGHRAELGNHVAAIESDGGVFRAKGFGFSGAREGRTLLERLARLLEPLEAAAIEEGGGGADIGPLMKEGVPGMDLRVHGERYFDFHHTPADTLDKLKPEELSSCVAALAVMAYALADAEETLPRDKSD